MCRNNRNTCVQISSYSCKNKIIYKPFKCIQTNDWCLTCCGADKHVDPTNELSLMRVSKWQPETMKGQKRGNKYNKWQFIVRSTNVCKVRDGRIQSSARMVTLIAGMVET